MQRIRKIVLVEPRAPGHHVYSRVRLPRLGLPLLAAILRSHGYQDIRIYCEDLAPLDLDDISRADFVGISTTTSTAPAAYRLGNQVKRLNRRAIVVLGGVHVTFVPEEPFDAAAVARAGAELPVCDYVIRGEAESLMPDLLRDIEDGVPGEPVRGEPLRREAQDRIDSNRVTADLDALPLPELESIVGHERMVIAPLTTSRGCPFDCNFCSVIEMFGQKIRYRSIDPDHPRGVIQELRNLLQSGRKRLFFYDDNFCASIARTKQLLETMLRTRTAPGMWSAQVRATEVTRDPELLDLMRRSNCKIVYMGLESINPSTLLAYNKKQTVEQIVEAVEVLKRYGIRTHGMFVFGADEDTLETLRATAEFAIQHDISTVQFLILTPLPGTRCYADLAAGGRVFDNDWSHYDAHHTVFFPKRMSPADLQAAALDGMARVYRRARALAPLLRGDWMTALLRHYGHRLVNEHIRSTVAYVQSLPVGPDTRSEPSQGLAAV